MATVRELTDFTPDGTRIGQSTGEKLGFYGLTTPITRPAAAAQSVIAKTTTTTATTTALQTDLDAVRTLALGLRTALVNLGLIKGSA